MPTPEPVSTRSPKRPVVLGGSASHSRADIALSQPIDPNQVVTFAIHLRENPNVNAGLVRLASLPMGQRHFLTDANFDPTKTSGADYYGADPADVKVVTDWIAGVNAGISDPAQQLSVSSIEYDIHAVKVSATAGQVSSLFKVDLRQWKQDDGTLTMGHTQDATIPAALAGVARGVIGFNTLGHFDPLYRRPDWWTEGSTWEPEPRAALLRPVARATRRVVDSARRMFGATLPGRPTYPDQLATFYGVPALGAAQVREPRVAILEYGGRTSQQALDSMGQRRGIAAGLIPRVERYYVGGIAPNFDPNANVEADLDAQVISIGLASKGIRHSLVEVNALDTEMGAGDAIAWAARDQGNPLGGAGADIASESWGDPKWNWTPYAIAYRRSANKFAMLKGVPVLVASGDNGSRDTTANPIVDYYSGDDLNVGVGGTHSWTDAAGRHELTWGGPQMSGATGGGVDPDVPTPYYQRKAGITPVTADTRKPGAGNPDVAANASPNSGAIILTGDDQNGNGASLQPVGGTSEAAPHWATFLAVAVALSGNRVGPAHGLLYAAWQQDQTLPAAQRVFRDITQGTNGDYDAAPGWDATTGLGSPADAGRLARTLTTIQPIAPDVQFSLSDAPMQPQHFSGLAA